jgi:hypothetical protein
MYGLDTCFTRDLFTIYSYMVTNIGINRDQWIICASIHCDGGHSYVMWKFLKLVIEFSKECIVVFQLQNKDFLETKLRRLLGSILMYIAFLLKS